MSDFYEPDEPVENVLAAFNRGPTNKTTAPDLAAENARLRAALDRVRALCDEWEHLTRDDISNGPLSPEWGDGHFDGLKAAALDLRAALDTGSTT